MERRDARSAAGQRWHRAAVRRTAWTVVDQGVSSGANFAVTVVAARTLSSESFAAFGVAFVVYVLALTLNRYTVAQPLMVRFGASTEARRELTAAAGTTVVLGAAAGAAILAGAALTGGETGRTVAVVAVVLPALLLQDTWRCGFVTLAEPRRAVVNDAVWLTAQVLIVAAALRVQPTATGLTVAWCLSGVVAAAYGIVQVGAWPRLSSAGGYLRRHADLVRPFAIEVVVVRSAPYIGFLLLGPIVGTLGLGALRGAQVLFGPFNVLMYGVAAAIVPEGGRVLRQRPSTVTDLLRVVSVACAGAALVWGAALLAMPDPWGVALLGDTWSHTQPLILAGVVGTLGTAAGVGAIVGLSIYERAWERVRLQVVVGIATLAVVVACGFAAGISGAAWGLAVGTWLAASGAWWAMRGAPASAVPGDRAEAAVVPGA